MKIALKMIAFPIVIILGLLVAFLKFVLLVSGTITTLLSILVAVLSIAMMVFSGFWNGFAWLVIAAIVFVLPFAAAFLVGGLDAANYALRGFIKN